MSDRWLPLPEGLFTGVSAPENPNGLGAQDNYDAETGSMRWDTLNTEELIHRRNEQTVAANIGAFTVPLGSRPLRRVMPVGSEDDYDVPDEYKGIYDLHYDDHKG